MTGRLANKVAVITGGGQEIGRGVAKAFAFEGAQIAVERDQVDEDIAAVVERFGGLDVVVTSALAKVKVQPFEETRFQVSKRCGGSDTSA